MGMAVILVMWPGPFEQTLVHTSSVVSIWNLSSIGPVVLEMFENGDGRQTESLVYNKLTIWAKNHEELPRRQKHKALKGVSCQSENLITLVICFKTIAKFYFVKIFLQNNSDLLIAYRENQTCFLSWPDRPPTGFCYISSFYSWHRSLKISLLHAVYG